MCGQGSVAPSNNGGAEDSPADTDDTANPPLTPDCLAGIETYNSDGPFTYRSERWGVVNAYIPDVPPGCKIPMVHYSSTE